MRSLIALIFAVRAFAGEVYYNDFKDPAGTRYSEWTSVPGTPVVVRSPNNKQSFLGEFGGPNVYAGRFVRVDQTVTLTLRNLKPHTKATLDFDLLILKSWDGNNPTYGPDRWKLSFAGGPVLLSTTFSNNHKTAAYDLSLQDYPAPDSRPQTGATSVNTLGYNFYGDATYHLTFTFPHMDETLVLHFASSLFEGKGTEDESWGLGKVRVTTD